MNAKPHPLAALPQVTTEVEYGPTTMYVHDVHNTRLSFATVTGSQLVLTDVFRLNTNLFPNGVQFARVRLGQFSHARTFVFLF